MSFFELSVPSPDGFDLLDFPIESLGSGVGLFMEKCIAYAFEMTFKHFGHLRGLFYRGLFDAFKPKLDVGMRFGVRIASKDGFELLTQPPGETDLEVGFLDDFEDLVLRCVRFDSFFKSA
ncbi:MAG: hypothetical protein OXD43_11225 [Bacteroidetes bacterium]|nr:hypothetical protein [Bacteroidota bacterium]